MAGYTIDQLQAMGAKPVASTAPASSPASAGKSYTVAQLQALGAKPVSAAPAAKTPAAPAAPQSLLQKAEGVGAGVLNFVNNNPVSKAITSLTALPVQLLAKGLGQPDPYAKGIGTGAGPLQPASVSTYQGKTNGQFGAEEAGNALQAASLAFPYGKVAEGVGALAEPLIGKTVGAGLGRIASGAAGGYGIDVASNLQNGKGADSFTPGAATLIGGALPLVPPVLGGIARGVGESLGVSTGAGYGALKEAFNAASAGGERAKAFTDALRGKTTPEAIVSDAKDALGTMISDRTKAYQDQLAEVTKDNTKSFDISPVQTKLDSMLKDFNVTKTEGGGLDFSRSPGLGRYKADLGEIQDVLDNWGSKPGDRTVVGIDKLKQTLDDFRRGTADSRKFDSFVTGVRNAAQNIIRKEPGYSKLVTDYTNSTGVIKDVQKALSLGDKASIDTGFRKLTTALRTNNEFRKELVDELDKASGGFLSSKVAGQQLSEALPRGLARQIEGFGALGVGVTGGVGAILPLLKFAAFASPRVVGEIVNALGISKRVFTGLLDHLAPEGAQFPGDRAVSEAGPAAKQYLAEHPPSLGLAMKDVNKMSPAELGALPKAVGDSVQGAVPAKPEAFQGFEDVTTKILDDLKGRSTVSKQYILDSLNRSDIKQAEKDIIKPLLDQEGPTINVKDFADKVKSEVLPLTRDPYMVTDGRAGMPDRPSTRYENVNLPEETRGETMNYGEHIYNSPIATKAGGTHFSDYVNGDPANYFAHTRTEDLQTDSPEWAARKIANGETPTPATRRVLEVQSDLFQKGNLEREQPIDAGYGAPDRTTLSNALTPEERAQHSAAYKVIMKDNPRAPKAQVDAAKSTIDTLEKKAVEQVNGPRRAELAKLQPYKNGWQDRIVREEVKQAANDGIKKLQFPTGDTAMKIEGLGGVEGNVPENVGVGGTFEYGGEDYRVIKEYGNDEVGVIPDRAIENEFDFDTARGEEIDNAYSNFISEAEDGDISRFVEPNTNYGGTWLSKEFQEGYAKASEEADKLGSKEPVANYLGDHEDEIRKVAENEIDNQYKNAEQMAEYFNDNMGGGYFAQGDRILYTGENGISEETMQRGNGDDDIDRDHPIHKYYEKELGKFLQKKYNAERVTDDQGHTWNEIDVPEAAAKLPVQAFGKAKIGALVGGAAASAAGVGALASRPQSLKR